MRRVFRIRNLVFFFVTIVVFGFVVVRPGSAQSKPTFGTCSFWNVEPVTEDSAATKKSAMELYHLGIAHGFALGVGANPQAYMPDRPLPTDIPFQKFLDMYIRGYTSVLQKPAVLMDAFNSKCADYKNINLRLTDLGLIAVLEVAGAKASQVEKALEILRVEAAKPIVERADVRLDVLKVFTSN